MLFELRRFDRCAAAIRIQGTNEQEGGPCGGLGDRKEAKAADWEAWGLQAPSALWGPENKKALLRTSPEKGLTLKGDAARCFLFSGKHSSSFRLVNNALA